MRARPAFKLLERAILGSLGQIVLLAVLTYGTLDTFESELSYRLTIIVGIALNLARLLLGIRTQFQKNWNPSENCTQFFSFFTSATALVWGASSWFLLRKGGLDAHTWMAFMLLCGTGSSAILSLVPHPRLAQLFVCILLAPPFIQLISSSDSHQWSIAGVFALYFIFLQSHIVYQEDLANSVAEKETQLEVMMDTALNSVPGIVWTADADGTPDFFNKTWYDYANFSAQNAEVDNSHWKKVVHQEDYPQFQERWKKACRDGIAFETEFRLKRASDQSYRLHAAKISPAKDIGGNVIKWIGTCLDVEDQRKAVEEKAQALVREKAAVESARLKSEFLANMSHEVRTPLNGILGMAELLRDSMASEDQKNYLRILRNSGDSLLSIINDILDFSKIEAGKLELEETDFDLVEVAKSQVELLNPRAFSKALTLQLLTDPRIPSRLVGDPGRVGQILLNLISNAIKFTVAGNIEIQLRCEELKEKSASVMFVVQDHGVGIDAETQSLLFRPFTQADNSTARKFGGTGLGLSICKRLAEMMQGTIGVESEIGQGAKFWFKLEFALAEKAEKITHSVEKTQAPVREVRAIAFSRNQKILVAEDNPTNQVLIVATLEKLGYCVQIAINGHEAVEALNRESFDLVLMDCQMPEMDGFTATQLIREREKISGKHIPILALTANAMKQDQDRCFEAGMDGHIPKPVKRKTLELVLNKWLGTPQDEENEAKEAA